MHWVAPADVAAHVAPYNVRMLEQVLTSGGAPSPAYLENSEVPGGLG